MSPGVVAVTQSEWMRHRSMTSPATHRTAHELLSILALEMRTSSSGLPSSSNPRAMTFRCFRDIQSDCRAKKA
jgi:hypothetical protein